ncbi:MAG: DUF6504 family protein [Anaerolineae bacterium]
MPYQPKRFIAEEITVDFDKVPLLEKKPGCPDGFTWRERDYRITELLAEWHDYRRRGRMAHNMRERHARAAARRGSWGVGRDYYRVRTADGRMFELTYDRAPGDMDDRAGSWCLYRELTES